MNKGQWINGSSVCPYYKKEGQNTIYCSGVIGCSSIHMAFGNASDCNAYKKSRCRSDYKQCTVYRMLEDMNDG